MNTKLPKCSKTLHFRIVAGNGSDSFESEQKAIKNPEICRLDARFGGKHPGISLSVLGVLRFLPEIWPLMCFLHRFEGGGERSA